MRLITNERIKKIGDEMVTNRLKPVIIFFSSAAYLGCMPFVPGTFGTLAGILLFWGLGRLPVGLYALVLIPLILGASFIAGQANRLYGRHDDSRIVIDEVVGYLVTMTGSSVSWPAMVLGFVLFRIFDILKPWPCRTIDRQWSGGLGVVMDDVAAGIYAGLVLHLFWFLRPVLAGLW